MKFYTYTHTRADDLKVFYVGKGHGSRAYSHAHTVHWKHVVAEHGRITNICAYFETEAEAFEHEKFLICCFRDMGSPLVNLTDGGEGCCGRIPSDAARINMSVAQKGHTRNQSVEARARMSEAKKGSVVSAETRAKISAAAKWRAPISEETRAKRAAANIGHTRNQNPETRAKISAAQKQRAPLSQESRAKMSATQKATWAVHKASADITKHKRSRVGYTHSAETRAKMSAANKGRVHTPEARDNMAAARAFVAARKAQNNLGPTP